MAKIISAMGRKKNNGPKYVVGGTVAVIILGIWVSLPLMNSTSSAFVAAGNPFASKVSDIALLDSGIAAEGSAPGGALSGEMINNPATSGESMLSSLFGSGEDGELPPVDVSAEAAAAPAGDSAVPAPGGSAGGSPMPSLGGGKLAPVASIGGGGGGSMTAGGSTHGKFFGSGADKAAFTPVSAGDARKVMNESPGRTAATALLSNAEKQSKLALRTGSMDAASGGASSPFSGGSKAGTTADLGGKSEETSSVAGLELGQSAANLKKNDPNLRKNEIKIPPPKEVKEPKDREEELKKMLLQMFVGALTKSIFGVSVPMGGGSGTGG